MVFYNCNRHMGSEFGDEWKIKRHLDDARRSGVFTNGHCHSLAFALHKLTGWDLIAAGTHEECEPRHIAVQSPTGRIFDVNGFSDLFEFEQKYGKVKRYKNLVYLRRKLNPFYRTAQTRTAMPYAKMLLEEYNL